MDRSYITKNQAQLDRLRTLVERLTDAELRRPMAAGWTIAAVLAHMTFWDARGLYLLDKWEGGVAPTEADWEPEDIDWANDAAKPLCLALPPRTAAALALQVAEETDRRVAAVSEELFARMEVAGMPFDLLRAEHRGEHLDDIEQYL